MQHRQISLGIEMLLLTFDTHGRRISLCGVSLNIADLNITVGCCSGYAKLGNFLPNQEMYAGSEHA